MKKLLFICKYRQGYGLKRHLSSGLLNSATFVNKMLQENGVISNLVQVIDNNCIDKEVALYKPDYVIIEALWVVPEKFDILHRLHPKVHWIIRLHSEIPFIANEGVAIEWIKKYMNYRNVHIAVNSKRMLNDLQEVITKDRILYLPNYYPLSSTSKKIRCKKNELHIGCFGSIRPMKNQLKQAISAIKYCNKANKILNFHINSTRLENRGEPVLKNLKALFENSKHKLVEHNWMQHDFFVKIIKKMDLNMQVSLSETFNIIAADSVNNNVPIICSNEISWINFLYKADANNTNSIVSKIKLALLLGKINFHFINKLKLWFYNFKSENEWLKFVNNEIIRKN